jgi:hypothetical protein
MSIYITVVQLVERRYAAFLPRLKTGVSCGDFYEYAHNQSDLTHHHLVCP